IKAGKINQADFYANPEKFSLVGEKPWIYRKIFDAPRELLKCDRINLVFDGLDTVTSIWLNDKLIGRTNNMFIPHTFEVTGLLRPKDNILLVKFESATQYAKKRMARYGSFSKSCSTNPYRVYIRKAQYQFGWDFCPELPGCGIYRPLRLEGIKNAEFDNIHIRTVDRTPGFADVKVTVRLNTVIKEAFLCKITLSSDSETFKHELHFDPGQDSNSTLFRIKNPLLWWPAGYGRQNLYNIDAQLLCDSEVIDKAQKKFGIRTIKLNRTTDEHGKNFKFEVNSQPVFAKGANWVPASIFARCTNPQDYENLLTAAAEANINMLRVWGGGYYEEDQFYELCDKLGIMVWQDFMFACAYYPDREWFSQEVTNEARTIITLLRNHPCLALWCGNNEIDWMHADAKLGRGKKFYGKAIYHRLLPRLVAELNPDTNYIPTTPLIEKDKFKINHHLTMHQWDVWFGHEPVRNYCCPSKSVPRFITEFGMQSLPGLETIKTLAPQGQRRIGSLPIEKHNYQLDGNSRLYRYIGDLFGSPRSLEQFIYLSQLTHARAAKAYVEHLRAHSLRNNGVLFWQFNDCFPAITWSAPQ
ncbi:MAG: glycoside hydrolase family 2 protein, partial [Planctomycetota bacterium]